MSTTNNGGCKGDFVPSVKEAGVNWPTIAPQAVVCSELPTRTCSGEVKFPH